MTGLGTSKQTVFFFASLFPLSVCCKGIFDFQLQSQLLLSTRLPPRRKQEGGGRTKNSIASTHATLAVAACCVFFARSSFGLPWSLLGFDCLFPPVCCFFSLSPPLTTGVLSSVVSCLQPTNKSWFVPHEPHDPKCLLECESVRVCSSFPHTPVPHTPFPHTPIPHTPFPHTPVPHTPVPHTPVPLTPFQRFAGAWVKRC